MIDWRSKNDFRRGEVIQGSLAARPLARYGAAVVLEEDDSCAAEWR